MATYRSFRFGRNDPSVLLSDRGLTMACATPLGPGLIIADHQGRINIDGPGAEILSCRQPDLAGVNDHFEALETAHGIVERLQRKYAPIRVGSSGDVYKAALTATLGQRITAREAATQWSRICRALGDPVSTPHVTLAAPPDPQTLANLVPYQLHRFGIEEARAKTLIGIARVFSREGRHQSNPHAALERIAQEVPRFGPWTRALVEFEALGDPDAVAIGDFHLKNVVAHAFTGRPRGTDAEMLELLKPYVGQRGRVLMWLALEGFAAPKFGPRRRNLDITRL